MSNPAGTLTIDTGEVRLCVNGDPTRVIAFNPTDVELADKFYAILGEFDAKEAEYKRRADEAGAIKEKDGHGVPVNFTDQTALLRDACTFARAKIDEAFGPGTSQTAFGDALSLSAVVQFFEGIAPYFRKAREVRVKPYLNPAAKTARQRHPRK